MVVYISRRVVLPLLLWHSHLIRSRAFAFSSSAASAVASSASRSSVANMIRDVQWIDLQVPPAELRPQFTLTNGQCFNWRPLDTAGESDAVWVGVVAGRQARVSGCLLLLLHDTDDETVDSLNVCHLCTCM